MDSLLVGEVNAAVEGAVASGAHTIIVHDGHGYGDSIPISKLHPAAKLSQGISNLHPLPHLDPSFDAILMIGQHAKAGSTGFQAAQS